MPLRQYIDSGGEYLEPYAKKKLAEMHDKMIGSGVRSLNKTIITDSSAAIYLASLNVGHGVFVDTLRITAGGSYLVGVTMPDPTPYRSLFLNTINAGSVSYSTVIVVVGPAGNNTNFSTTTISVNGAPYNSIVGVSVISGGNASFTNYTEAGFEYNGTIPPGATIIPIETTPEYVAAVAYGKTLAMLNVNMSDGTQLVSAPRPDGSNPAFSGAWLGEEGTLLSDGSFLAFAVPADTQSSLSGATAKIREKARLQTNSANALNLLKAGALVNLPLPADGSSQLAGWDYQVKSQKPDSVLPRVIYPFAVNRVETVTSDGSGGTVITRTDTASYTAADGVLQQQVIVGTKTALADGYTFVYNNYPAYNATGTQQGGRITATEVLQSTLGGPVPDGFIYDMGALLTGTRINRGLRTDSTFGVPANIGSAAPPFDSSTLQVVTLPLYLQYIAVVKPVDVNTLPVPLPARVLNWLSTSMVPGEVITLIPFAPVLAGEDLGMFGPTTGATQVATYGYANFRYNIDGSFTFVTWHDNPQVDDMLDAAGTAITWPGPNCIVKYTKFGWKDTQATAAAQALALVAPTTNANKFLKLIKQAQGI